MKLKMSKRVCHLGGHLNGRTEFEGDEPVGACDLTLSNLLLAENEIDELLGDGTWNRLFKKTRNSGMDGFPEPADFIANSKMPLQFERKFEESKAKLFLGLDGEDSVELAKSTLAKIRYEPQSGGLVLVSLQVQCNATPEQVAALYTHMDTEVSAWIHFGKIVEKDDKQGELPMNAQGGGADGDDATRGAVAH